MKFYYLEEDEELAKTKLSYKFLKYLYSIKDLEQFIIIENIDIPTGLNKEISIVTFHGINKDGNRIALF